MAKRRGISLTKSEVARILPGPSIRRVWDKDTQGLGIQVTPAGAYSWVLSYRVHQRKDMFTLGRWPEMSVELARKAAVALWVQINAGIDPKQARADARRADEEARRAKETVADLVSEYKDKHTPENGPGWQKESTRLMNKHILPALGKVPVREVSPADISGLLRKLKDTPTTARLVRAVLRSMFSRAEEWDMRPLGSNPVPVAKLPKGAGTTKRDRRLSDIELKALGLALKCSMESPETVLALRLALLAGMRKGEIQEARWEWLDLEAGLIRIPKEFHKTGRKTQKPRVVHLCPPLVAELDALSPTLGCPFIVPGSRDEDEEGRVIWKPFTALQNVWERTREAAGLTVKGEPKDEDPGLHDLRRTFASVGTDMGLKGFVGELLGHAEATVTDIYTRASAEPLHEAAEKIGARIEGILTGQIDPEKEAEARRKAKQRKAEGA